ncbi:MAG: glutathione S-transferase family protein [Pseudomonadota bacterium]
MKLYTVQVAPNPTKVELYLAEKVAKGIPDEIERVKVRLTKGEQNEPPHLARNPFGSIPVLEMGEGDYLIESHAIIEFLEEFYAANFPTSSMWGEALLDRARNRDYGGIADARILMPLGRYIHATNSPIGLPRSDDIANAALPQLDRGFAYFDKLLSDRRDYIGGDQPTVADCTLAAAMQFGRFGGFELDEKYSYVAKWDQRFRARATAQSVLVT